MDPNQKDGHQSPVARLGPLRELCARRAAALHGLGGAAVVAGRTGGADGGRRCRSETLGPLGKQSGLLGGVKHSVCYMGFYFLLKCLSWLSSLGPSFSALRFAPCGRPDRSMEAFSRVRTAPPRSSTCPRGSCSRSRLGESSRVEKGRGWDEAMGPNLHPVAPKKLWTRNRERKAQSSLKGIGDGLNAWRCSTIQLHRERWGVFHARRFRTMFRTSIHFLKKRELNQDPQPELSNGRTSCKDVPKNPLGRARKADVQTFIRPTSDGLQPSSVRSLRS